VYAYLIGEYPDIFYEPTDVKAWLIADSLEASRDSVNAALKLLIAQGFALDHGRTVNNVRRLTLARVRHLPPKQAASAA
jgi:hypothetical protein